MFEKDFWKSYIYSFDIGLLVGIQLYTLIS